MSKEQNITFLMEMGFDRELASEAIRINGYVEPAIQWCLKKQQTAIGYTLGGTGQPLGTGASGQSLGTASAETIPDIPPDIPPEIPPEPPKKQMTAEEKEAALQKIKQRIEEKKQDD